MNKLDILQTFILIFHTNMRVVQMFDAIPARLDKVLLHYRCVVLQTRRICLA